MEEYKITSVSSFVRIFIDQNIEICASPSNVKPTVQCLGPMMMVPRVRFPYLNTISTMLEFDISPLHLLLQVSGNGVEHGHGIGAICSHCLRRVLSLILWFGPVTTDTFVQPNILSGSRE